MYISQPDQHPHYLPSPVLSRSPLEKPNGVRVEVLNPIEKCYFNADARPLRQQQQGERLKGKELKSCWSKQPQNWIKVCYTPHGAGSRQRASQTDARAGNCR